jgi:hypothetical protein
MGKLEISLFLISVAVGVVMWLLPKSLLTVIGSLIIIFGLLVYPVWNFPWVEKSLWLRIGALLLIASMLCLLGYISLPKPEQPIIGKSESAISPSNNKTPAQPPMTATPETEKPEKPTQKKEPTETKEIESERQIAEIQSLAHDIEVNEQMINTAVELAKRWPMRSEKENFSYASYNELPITEMISTKALDPTSDREMLENLDRYQQAIKEFNAKLRNVGRHNPGMFIKGNLIPVKEPKQWPNRIEEVLAEPFQKLLHAHKTARDLLRARYSVDNGSFKETKLPSKKQDGSVLDLIARYPVIYEVIKGEKRCGDLAPEAQIVCVKENARLKFAAMVLTHPGLTAEQRTRILQQTTLADMKRIYETLTLNAVASFSAEAHIIFVPPEVASVYLFLQKGDALSEFVGRISRDEFLNNVSQYEKMAKNKGMKLIIRASTKDEKQWLQNQIKYDDKLLKKSIFREPSTDKISEGVEWPLN